ncbi:MAG: hypothetical protein WDN24_13820 [Sphingomonas sp.]
MRDSDVRRRLTYAVLFALVAGTLLVFGNPADRIKADLRADARGFVLSLEYSADMAGVNRISQRS